MKSMPSEGLSEVNGQGQMRMRKSCQVKTVKEEVAGAPARQRFVVAAAFIRIGQNRTSTNTSYWQMGQNLLSDIYQYWNYRI